MTVGTVRLADGGERCVKGGMVICYSKPRPGKAEGERARDGPSFLCSAEGPSIEESSDAFNKKGRQELSMCLEKLPEHTRFTTDRVLDQLDSVTEQIKMLEKRIQEVFAPNEGIHLLESLPGVGLILAVVILSEVGDVDIPRRSDIRKLPDVIDSTDE
jgi:transposase